MPSDCAVSVIVRTFNRPRLLQRCLAHLAAQTCGDFEVVVVNDAGVDVADTVAAFAAQLRVRVVTHDRNRGRTAALNTGLHAARGRFVCFVDDDDVVYADHLAMLLAAADDGAAGRVVYTRAVEAVEDGSGQVLHRRLVHDQDFDRDLLLLTNYLPILTVLAPRELALRAGGFDERLEVLEDWEFWIRLSALTPFVSVDLVTCEYRVRVGGDNCTLREAPAFARARAAVYERHAPGARFAQERAAFLQHRVAVAPAHAYPFSLVIASGADPDALLACLENIVATLGEDGYETVLVSPTAPALGPLLRALEGDVTILSMDTVSPAAAWAAGAAKASGRVRVVLTDDDRIDATLLARVQAAADDSQIGVQLRSGSCG